MVAGAVLSTLAGVAIAFGSVDFFVAGCAVAALPEVLVGAAASFFEAAIFAVVVVFGVETGAVASCAGFFTVLVVAIRNVLH
ncbi:MAG: hypothetical protein OEL57_00835 [Trichlorobacter sp.]|uniref:hypothetical protein n=1 Tax=Trichlorobacter sp. TaxID=2911007 RepID=UPI0025604F4E|nr:hypothetical protein [Trichlorobacter sp.]MDK9716435.1 hypothetical protein [Trichlorobacter sp.]